MLLLGKGGKTVYAMRLCPEVNCSAGVAMNGVHCGRYIGPTAEAAAYFSSLGLERPPLVNPADFYMDSIAGDVPDDFRAAHAGWAPKGTLRNSFS